MFFELFILAVSLFAVASVIFSRASFRPHASEKNCFEFNNRWYPLKYSLAFILLSLRRRKQKKLTEPNLQNFWSSINVTERAKLQESPQNLSQWSEKANDAIAFQGADLDGNHLLIRLGRRANGRKEFWLCLRLANSTGSHDDYTHPEHPNTQMLCSLDSCDWTVEGLDCHMREPMRKWRISYNGWLRKGIRKDYEEDRRQDDLVWVKFSFIWTAMSDVIDFNKDLHPTMVAQALAREPWSREFFDDLQSMHEDRYEQWGQMTGSISVEQDQPVNLVLRGMRDHCYGERDWTKYDRYTANMGFCEDGTFFHVGGVSIPKSTKHLVYGYFGSFAHVTPVEYCSILLPILGADGVPPKEFTIGFGAGTHTFLLRCCVRAQIVVYNGSQWESKSNLRFVDMELNGKPATGFSEFEYRSPLDFSPPNKALMLQPSGYLPKCGEVHSFLETSVLPLSHRVCANESLVGGKGKQLAQLSQLQGDFSVPEGICVTTKAFQQFLEKNPLVQESLKILQGNESINQINFEHIRHCFASATLPEALSEQISAQLLRIFGNGWREISFAVRSSAIGEDGSEASSAGQMDTVLGVAGMAKISAAIVKCWASAFKEQPVHYRVQHGGAPFVGSGIVIQSLVPATISGVLFTCDPVTGHPGQLTINASYGLGEAVVSGITEPDHITVTVDYYDANLRITDKVMGSKSTRILPDGSSVSVTDSSNVECCLNDDQILRLAKIGLDMKRAFGSHRDIEWAIDLNGLIYLLQCRPVTTLNFESDFELIHEFDSPVYSVDDFSTTHNVGEVMGGAVTPLGVSVALSTVDRAIQHQMMKNGVAPGLHPDVMHVYTMHGGHIMLKLSETMYRDPGVVTNRHVSELCILGQVIKNEHLDRIMDERFRSYSKIKLTLQIAKTLKEMMFSANSMKEQCMEAYKGYSFPMRQNQSPAVILNSIENCFQDYFKVWYTHVLNSGYSGFWYHLIMGFMVKEESDWSSSTLQDVAAIYSSCTDVESAEVPSALQELASAIKLETSGLEMDFCEMKPSDAVEWLHGHTSGKAGATFKRFLTRHGHRCIHEIDFIEKSWSEDPETIIPVLQIMVSSSDELCHTKKHDTELSPEKIVAKLNTKMTFIERNIVQWAIPRARAAVGNREQTKSLSVRVGHAIRIGYRQLGKALVKHHWLPEADLLYYLTHYEVKQLVKDQGWRGRLIARAQRRRRVRQLQIEIDLPEIARGYPIPISKHNQEPMTHGEILKGTPVSSGKVTAPVRVCKTLEEAVHIQRGEILIAHCTDIAWSIYFPLLGGVVTELGGLLSHGAVVAREYGLPCVVSAKQATDIFESGDVVLLDANEGSISIVTKN